MKLIIICFFEHISTRLVQDFSIRELARYYSTVRGIIELEHRQSVIVKNTTGIDAAVETRSRHSVHPSNVQGGYIHLLVLNSQPEPWEEVEAHRQKDIDFEQF
jgi:hypothetical protein